MNSHTPSFQELKTELIEIKDFLIRFLPRPIEIIRQVPIWSWRKILVAQLSTTILCGALGGLVSLSFHGVILGIFITPIVTTTLTFIASFFHYTFLILTGQQPQFRKLHMVVFLSLIPFFILNTGSAIIPPLSLIGLAFAGFLMIVGFVDNLSLPRKFTTRVVVGCIAVLVLFWAISLIRQMDWNEWKNSDREAYPEVHLGK